MAATVLLERFAPEVVSGILADWRDRPDAAVLALVPEAEKAVVPDLQALCRGHGIQLAGAVFPALVSSAGFPTAGIVLLRLPAGEFSLLAEDLASPEAPATAAVALTSLIERQVPADTEATLLAIFDGLLPNIATILDTLYLNLADRVHYVGVNAGSETFQTMPCVFDADRIVANGGLFVVLPGHPGATLEHGYKSPARMITATSASGNHITQIDWRPPFEVYKELMASQYGIAVTRENFYQNAVHYPLGIVLADGQVLVRIPVALEDNGSIYCVGEIPPNSLLTLLEAPSAEAGVAAKLAANLDALGAAPRGGDLVTFFCAGRRMHLGETASRELEQLTAATGARLVGALTLGEIGTTRAGTYPLFHNATIVCCPWPAT